VASSTVTPVPSTPGAAELTGACSVSFTLLSSASAA
jgi:hypothetical protein